MKLYLAQIRPVQAHPNANLDKICQVLNALDPQASDLVVFPELSVPGYPLTDAVLDREYVQGFTEALTQRMQAYPKFNVLLGSCHWPEGNLKPKNAALGFSQGKLAFVSEKAVLPDDSVFCESRYFEAGQSGKVWQLDKGRVAVSICADVWTQPFWSGGLYAQRSPLLDIKWQDVDVHVNLSASPFEVGKHAQRRAMMSAVLKHTQTPFVYVNSVGGQDDLIFDGNTTVMWPDGTSTCLGAFEEKIECVDMKASEKSTANAVESSDSIENISLALNMGLRDFLGGIHAQTLVIGISGGIDSAVVAALACEAWGADRVLGIMMPTRYTSDLSLRLSRQLASNLGMRLKEVSIDETFGSIQTHVEALLKTPSLNDLTCENIQARLRGLMLNAVANDVSGIILNTSNKSELAMGYSTLYGDTVGAISPIGDLTKRRVFALGQQLNVKAAVIPQEIFDRPPSAELKPDQKDEDTLPPYASIDRWIEEKLEPGKSRQAFLDTGFDETLLDMLEAKLASSEFKRRQFSPILRVTYHAFGRGWKYAIAKESPAQNA